MLVFLLHCSFNFPQIFSNVTLKRIHRGLTDEDPSEYKTFESYTQIDNNYHQSKIMLCIFHGIWKPFKENIHSWLPKDHGGILLSGIG
jgi:hypothetical protein